MAYTKNSWKSGDVVTSSKLNHMEDGIASAGGVMVVHHTLNESTGLETLDKTWQEVYDAVADGIFVMICGQGPTGIFCNFVVSAENGVDGYAVKAIAPDEVLVYTTDSASGYPKFEGGVG